MLRCQNQHLLGVRGTRLSPQSTFRPRFEWSVVPTDIRGLQPRLSAGRGSALRRRRSGPLTCHLNIETYASRTNEPDRPATSFSAKQIKHNTYPPAERAARENVIGEGNQKRKRPAGMGTSSELRGRRSTGQLLQIVSSVVWSEKLDTAPSPG